MKWQHYRHPRDLIFFFSWKFGVSFNGLLSKIKKKFIVFVMMRCKFDDINYFQFHLLSSFVSKITKVTFSFNKLHKNVWHEWMAMKKNSDDTFQKNATWIKILWWKCNVTTEIGCSTTFFYCHFFNVTCCTIHHILWQESKYIYFFAISMFENAVEIFAIKKLFFQRNSRKTDER